MTKFLYVRNSKKFPVACIAYSLDKSNDTITYGLSIYNPSDTFDREMARNVAEGRMLKRGRVIPCQVEEKPHQKIMDDLWALITGAMGESFDGSLGTNPTSHLIKAVRNWVSSIVIYF